MAVLQTSNGGYGLLARTVAAHGPTQFAHGWAVVTLQLVEVRKTNSRTWAMHSWPLAVGTFVVKMSAG
jgi:hypothetical protein